MAAFEIPQTSRVPCGDVSMNEILFAANIGLTNEKEAPELML